MQAKELISDFLKLQSSYVHTKRALVTAERYINIAQKGLVSTKDYNNELLRESLVEHIGHLPILASYFYPYLKEKENINLGRVLIMLSIHDIGETVTGEIFAYNKTQEDGEEELKHALKVLHLSLHPYLMEFEEDKTMDAKYARCVDALAPNIREIEMPKITIERFNLLNAKVQNIIDKKRKYFEFDPLMLEIFDLLMLQYKNIENGLPPIFEPKEYDIV